VLESVAQNGGKYYAYAIVPGEEAMHSGDTFDKSTAPSIVILDGHRDDLTVFHDSISINGVVTKLGTSYPAFNRGWGAALKCSLQLDGNGKGDPYKVKYRNAVYSAW
jgi:hypothetical protein